MSVDVNQPILKMDLNRFLPDLSPEELSQILEAKMELIKHNQVSFWKMYLNGLHK